MINFSITLLGYTLSLTTVVQGFPVKMSLFPDKLKRLPITMYCTATVQNVFRAHQVVACYLWCSAL